MATPEKLAELQAKVNAELDLDANEVGLSHRRNGLDLKPTTCRRMLKELKVHAFKQWLTPSGRVADRPVRIAFCRMVLSREQPFFDKLQITDEATFR